MTAYPLATCCPIFSWFEEPIWIQFYQEGRGSTHWGGSRFVPMTLWLLLLTSSKVKFNYFTLMNVGRRSTFLLPTSFRGNNYRISQKDVLIYFLGSIWKNFMITQKSCRPPSEKLLTNNFTQTVFLISTLPAQEKTELFFLASNPIP